MNCRQVAYAIHGLGLGYAHLVALHHALDTPEYCIQRIQTELVSQGFKMDAACADRRFVRNIVVTGEYFTKRRPPCADCFLFQRFSNLIWHHEHTPNTLHTDKAFLQWDKRVFLIASRRVDCRNAKQLIKELLYH